MSITPGSLPPNLMTRAVHYAVCAAVGPQHPNREHATNLETRAANGVICAAAGLQPCLPSCQFPLWGSLLAGLLPAWRSILAGSPEERRP